MYSTNHRSLSSKEVEGYQTKGVAFDQSSLTEVALGNSVPLVTRCSPGDDDLPPCDTHDLWPRSEVSFGLAKSLLLGWPLNSSKMVSLAINLVCH